MPNNKRKPAIRFKGFTDDWEQRKLGELCDVYDGTHQTPNYKNSGIMFLSVENINSLKSEKYISENDFINDFNIFPEKGDVLMTRIGDIGTANVVESNEPKAYYVSLALLKKKLLDSYFLKESISSKTVKNDLWKRTLHIAFPKKINKNEIAEILIPYPGKREEQKQIGMFFKNLDDLITLNQRKYDKLVNIKKAMLEKMFPRNGAKVPEVRFVGFTDAWEQRKLGDETIEMVAGGDIDKSKLDESGIFPVLANALTNDGIIGYYTSEYRIKAPAVTVTGRGDVGHAKARKTHFTPVVRLLSIRSHHDVYFLENAINILKIVIESTGVPQLTVPQLGSYEVSFPKSLEEEKAIGKFFYNLDNLITLHQREVEKLKNIKKSCLEKMFV